MQPAPSASAPELVQPQGSSGVGRRGCRSLLGNGPGATVRAGGLEGLGGRHLLTQRALSPQRLKDEIAEVTNEIENLGSTEER